MKKLKLFVYLMSLSCAPLVHADEANKIPFVQEIELSVGEEAVIHGLRGKCGELPAFDPNWQSASKRGYAKFGKPGVRGSRTCGGPTPAIEIIFIATKPGREKLEMFGDTISIRVKR